MVARRAWVVTATLNDAAAYVGHAPGHQFTKVVGLLRATRGVSYVAEVIDLLDAMLALDLQDQRQELTRHRADGRLHHMTRAPGGVDIYVLSHPVDFRAQRSTIRRIEETDEGEWLEWRPDPYDIVKVDPDTHQVAVVGRQMFDWKRAPRVDFSPRHWFD